MDYQQPICGYAVNNSSCSNNSECSKIETIEIWAEIFKPAEDPEFPGDGDWKQARRRSKESFRKQASLREWIHLLPTPRFDNKACLFLDIILSPAPQNFNEFTCRSA